MLLFWGAQYLTGWNDHNEELAELNQSTVSFLEYRKTGHFISATFENWESEFLQMGSPESKPVDTPHSETGKD